MVDSAIRQLPDASVGLRRGELLEFPVLDMQFSSVTAVFASSTTDANCEFKLAIAQERSTYLEIRGPAREPSWNKVILVERLAIAGARGLVLQLL